MNTKLKSAIAAILSCAVTGAAAQPGGFDTMYLSQTLTEVSRSSVKIEDWALGSAAFTVASKDTPMVNDGEHQFEIMANLEWQDSITVKAGQTISLSASGVWSHNSGTDNYGPDGSSNTDNGILLPSATVGVLIGRIGEGTPFVVGTSTTHTAETDGMLQLSINDWGFEGNTGSVMVQIGIQLEVPPAQPTTTAKTIELCTAIDGSGSITDPAHGGDPLNFQKQLDGLAKAIQDSAVFPKDGTVTISVVQFSGSSQLEVPPTLIDSQATADAVAAQVRGIQQFPISTGTDIGGAITFCTDQFKFTSEKQIVDVSTDGSSNGGTDPVTAASEMVAKGVDAINALGVGSGVDQAQLNAMVRPQPICTITGQTNCGFVSLIRNFDQYAAAIKRKITMETGGTYVVEAGECGNTKEANYTVPLGPIGFYVVEAALPTDQPPGVWSLLVDTMSHAPLRSREQAIPYPGGWYGGVGGWYGGVVLRENGLSPSWVGFSLAKSEAVEITATDFLQNLPAFTLEVVKKVGTDRWQSVFKQESVVPEQVYTTSTLARGFYAVVVTGTALSPRGRLGFYVKGKSLYGAVTGGWIDHLDGGYSAFFVQSAQKTADLKLLFCDSYGEAGAGQPAVQMLYVKEDGTKEVFWKAQ